MILAKHAYRIYRAQGLGGVLRRLSSPRVWKNALPHLFHVRDRRVVLSHRYIRGSGIEIGALNQPLAVTSATTVTYIDRMDVHGLRRAYPEITDWPLVEVGIVDNGETLSLIPDGSQDFIIANHFLEHCENPLGTIRQHLTKLKPSGVLFYALPDKRRTFDAQRPLTSFEHLVADDRDGPERSRTEHYREWVRLVDGEEDPAKLETKTQELENSGYSIHFHVWDNSSFSDFLQRARVYLGDAFEVRENKATGAEIIVILQAAEGLE